MQLTQFLLSSTYLSQDLSITGLSQLLPMFPQPPVPAFLLWEAKGMCSCKLEINKCCLAIWWLPLAWPKLELCPVICHWYSCGNMRALTALPYVKVGWNSAVEREDEWGRGDIDGHEVSLPKPCSFREWLDYDCPFGVSSGCLWFTNRASGTVIKTLLLHFLMPEVLF